MVFLPALAMESRPGPVCFNLKFSSSKLSALPHRCPSEPFFGLPISVDGLASGAIKIGKVSTLNHKVFDNTMKDGSLVAKAFFSSACAWSVKPHTLKPVHSALKFSAVLGTTSPNKPKTILPADTSPISTTVVSQAYTSKRKLGGASTNQHRRKPCW